MTFSFNAKGQLVVSVTFTDVSKTYTKVVYTGGIPPGQNLDYGSGQKADQGVLVIYNVTNTPSGSPTTITWTLPEYADGSSDPYEFTLKFFLMEEGKTTPTDSSPKTKTKFPT